MNLGDGKGLKAGGDVLSNQFPAGLRVLLVDDDRTCLMIMDKMLKACLYEVTKCNRAEVALSLLRENKNGYNIVISDVHMPDMDGFKLLEHIGLEMDLPVIMMSGDDEKNVVMKGVTHGACDYLIKPVRMEALRNIWQHVVRRRKNEWKDLEQSGSAEEGDRQSKQLEDAHYSPSANEGSSKESKRKKDEEEETEEREDTSTLKKPRVVWTPELHQQFVAVVNQLGIDKAVPKKILELMNVPGLTRENVASHLQKFRLYLRRMNGVSQHPNNLTGSFIGTQEATYGPLSSLGGLDLQTLAATGQLPPQSLATLQAAGLHRSTRMPMPIVEKRPFSFGNPELRFGEGQQQHLNSKPINLLQGIPTKMDRLANFRHSLHEGMNMQVNVYGSQVVQSVSLMMQMSQPQARGQLLNDNTGNHIGQLPSSIGQPIMPNAVSGRVLARNGLVETGRGKGFGPTSQSSSMLNFLPLNNSAELSGNAFPLGSAPRTLSLASAGGFQDEVTSDIKVSAGFMPSQEIFSNLHQQNYNDWKLQNAGFTFNSSQQPDSMQSNLDGGASVLVHTGFSPRQREEENRTAASVVKPIFSTGDTTEHVNVQSARQQLNTLFADNSVRVKAEGVPDTSCQTTLFPEQFGQGDLMSALLKQQQGGNAPAEDDFDFNSYP